MADRRRANFRMRSIGSLPLKTQRRIPADDIADGVASNLGIRMTTRALTGRRVKNVEAQGEHRGERRDRGGVRERERVSVRHPSRCEGAKNGEDGERCCVLKGDIPWMIFYSWPSSAPPPPRHLLRVSSVPLMPFSPHRRK